MSSDQVKAHRQTPQYREFMEGPIVTAIHAMFYPLVGQSEDEEETTGL